MKHGDSYCFETPEDAKNLLKNRALDKGYQGELRGMFEDLKGQDK